VVVQLHGIEVGSRALGDYGPLAGADAVERIRALARPLEGLRVLHLAAAEPAGRAAEVLRTLLPLLEDVGVQVAWRVLAGGPAAASVARQLDDGLRGGETAIAAEDWAAYRDAWHAAMAAADDHDVLVAHDPAAVGAGDAPEGPGRRIWRCHVDASRPDPPAWERARTAAEGFDACAVPLAAFAPPGLPAERVRAAPPGIDPFGPRNRELPVRLAGDALRLLGLDLEHPLCCQVGVLDPWGDPHETIDAFRLARAELPELQLVLAGTPVRDDSEGWRLTGEIADYAEAVPGVHVLTGYAGVGELELNAMQRLSRVALVSALREDFGLAASEAMWKGTPVVAPPRGGVPEQVRDGADGFLAEGAERVAERLVELVRDAALGIDLGAAGRERVRERFLATRMLEAELELLAAAVRGDLATVRS
jgi:trehalose synthase